jgi:sugar phosphate isomerase/epimerase
MIFKIGAQTIVWGENIKSNMERIVEFLAREGFSGVETGMRHFDPGKAGDYRRLYEKNGITPLGVHIGGKFWEPEQAEEEMRKADAAASFAAEAGFRHLVVSGNPRETPESMRRAAAVYEGLGRRCAEKGLRFAYHDHDWELRDDAAVLSALLDNTSPDRVSLVLDVAWAHIAGADLDRLFSRYGSRIAYLHIKDVRGRTFCELGTGNINHHLTHRLAEKYGIEWLVIEQDTTELGPEDSMRKNMAYLKEHL